MLQGRVALITGADTAVGSAIARRFAFEGASLVLASEDSAALKNLDDEIKKLGDEAILVQLDVLDLEQIEALSSSVRNIFKKLDILVASHFYTGKPNLLIDYTPEIIKKIIDVNFCASCYLIKYCDRLFRLSDSARIVFTIVESFASKSLSSFSPYVASRAAIEKLISNYQEEVQHAAIKANIVAIEEYAEGPDIKMSDDFTDIFVRLASKNLRISGRKHHVQY